jgi:hypothetical protein
MHVTAGRRAAPDISARIRDTSSPTGVNGEKASGAAPGRL